MTNRRARVAPGSRMRPYRGKGGGGQGGSWGGGQSGFSNTSTLWSPSQFDSRCSEMAGKFHHRKAHMRRGPSGKIIEVRACEYWREDRSDDPDGTRKSYKRICPSCGATILTMQMPRGGWAHFEDGMLHLGTLHSCFTIGRGMSRRRALAIRDLFESIEKPDTDDSGHEPDQSGQ